MCLREESEPHTYDSSGILAYFNPRFREGSDPYDQSNGICIIDFNPRFREGSDKAPPFLATPFKISIHASAKEATYDNKCLLITAVFQSTLPRRKRHTTRSLAICLSSFQSTLPRRKRRLVCIWHSCIIGFQSTLPRRKRLLGGFSY